MSRRCPIDNRPCDCAAPACPLATQEVDPCPRHVAVIQRAQRAAAASAFVESQGNWPPLAGAPPPRWARARRRRGS